MGMDTCQVPFTHRAVASEMTLCLHNNCMGAVSIHTSPLECHRSGEGGPGRLGVRAVAAFGKKRTN